MLQVKDMLLWFWYAVDSETRMIIHCKISWNRTNTTCKKFFQEIEQRYGKKAELVLTDSGPWYKILPRIGWSYEAISGGIRSYVERVIETVKGRIRLFDHYFPRGHPWVAGYVK
jgi:transposase-like protein